MENNAIQNDWVATQLAFSSADPDNLAQNNITPENTFIKDRETYKEKKKIQEAFTNPDTGKFEEEKYNKFYDNMLYSYNAFVTGEYEKVAAKAFEYSPYDPLAPEGSKLAEYGFEIQKVRNPFRETKGFAGINEIQASEFTKEEIAQTNTVRDYITGKSLGYTPNDGFFGKKTAVFAEFDQDGWVKDPYDGTMVFRKKGEAKTDENGDFYYENLGDREVYNKRVLTWADTLTTDGSFMNKFDFMDSDGKDKAIAGIIAKQVVTTAPLFLGAFGVPALGAIASIYAAGIVGLDLLNLAPALIKGGVGIVVNDAHTDKEYWKTLNKMQGFSQSLSNSSRSEYARNHVFGAESIISMAGDTFKQLYSQRMISQIPSMLGMTKVDAGAGAQINMMFGKNIYDKAASGSLSAAEKAEVLMKIPQAANFVNRIAKSTKLASGLATAYMAGTSAVSITEEAKRMGLNERDTGLMLMGVTAGFFGMMRALPIGEWAMKGTGLDEKGRLMRGAVKYHMNELKGLIQSYSGDPANQSKFYKLAVNIGDKVGRTLSGEIDDYGAAMIAEGTEEVSEELMQDTFRNAYNGLSYLGLTSTEDKKFDFGGTGNIFERYATAALGGAMGGALFKFNDRVIHKMQQTLPDNVKYDLAYLAKEGYAQDFIDAVNKKRTGDGFSSKQLSTDSEIITGEDGKPTKVFKPVTKDRTSQNDAVADYLVGMMNFTKDVLYQEGVPSDIAMAERLKARTDIMIDLKLNSPLYEDVNKLGKELVDLRSEIIIASTPDPNAPTTGVEVESMKKKVQELNVQLGLKQKELEEILSGKAFPEYQRKALFGMSKTISDPYLGTSFEEYVKIKKGVEPGELSATDRLEAEKEYNTFKSLSGREAREAAYKLFTLHNEKFSPFLPELSAYADQRKGHYEIVNGEYESIKYKISPELMDLLESRKAGINKRDYKYLYDADGNPISNFTNQQEVNEILSIVTNPGIPKLDAAVVRDFTETMDGLKLENFVNPYAVLADADTSGQLNLESFPEDPSFLEQIFATVPASNLEDGAALQAAIETGIIKAYADQGIEVDPAQARFQAETLTQLILNDATIAKFQEQHKVFTASIQGKSIDTINQLMKQFGIAVGKESIDIIDLITKELDQIEKIDAVTNYVINDATAIEALERAPRLIAQIKSQIIAAIDYPTLVALNKNAVSGYNSVVNKTFPESNLGTITAEQGFELLQELNILEDKVKFLLDLHKINNEDKIKNQKETGIVMEGLFLEQILPGSAFGKHLHSLQVNNKDFFNKEIRDAIENAVTLQEVIASKRSLEGSKVPLPKDLLKIEQEKTRINQALQKRIQELSAEGVSKKVIFDAIFRHPAAEAIFTEDSIAEETDFSSTCTAVKPNALLTWFVTNLAVDNAEFYAELEGEKMKDGTFNGMEQNKYAPFYNQLYTAKIAYALVNNVEWINLAADYLNERKVTYGVQTVDGVKKGLLTVFYNAILINGLPGSGKSTAIASFIAKMLERKGLTCWASAPDAIRAKNVNNNIGQKAAQVLDKTQLVSRFIKPDVLAAIRLEEETQKYGTYIEKIDTKNAQGNVDTQYKLKELDPANLMLDEADMPTVIFIDEVTHFSAMELGILSQAFNKMANPPKIIFMGDLEQSGHQLSYMEEGVGGKLRTEDSNINQFTVVQTPKLAASIRNSNNHKKYNLSLLFLHSQRVKEAYAKVGKEIGYTSKEALAEIRSKSEKQGQSLKFRSHVNDQKVIFGEKLITKGELTLDLIKEIPIPKEGKIAYITDDRSDAIAEAIRKDTNLAASFEVKTAQEIFDIKEPKEVQGLEYDHVIINVDWNKVMAKDPTFSAKNLIKGLYTLTSRSKVGTILVDNGLTDANTPIKIEHEDEKGVIFTALGEDAIKKFKTEQIELLKKLREEFPFDLEKSKKTASASSGSPSTTAVSGEKITYSSDVEATVAGVIETELEGQETEREITQIPSENPTDIWMYPFYERWGIPKNWFEKVTDRELEKLDQQSEFDDMEYYVERIDDEKERDKRIKDIRNILSALKSTIFYRGNLSGIDKILGEGLFDYSQAKLVLRSSKYKGVIDDIHTDSLYRPDKTLEEGTPNTRLALELPILDEDGADTGKKMYFSLAAMADNRTVQESKMTSPELKVETELMNNYFLEELKKNPGKSVNLYPTNQENQLELLRRNTNIRLRNFGKDTKGNPVRKSLAEIQADTPGAVYSPVYILTGKAPNDQIVDSEAFVNYIKHTQKTDKNGKPLSKKQIAQRKLAGKQVVFVSYDNIQPANLHKEWLKEWRKPKRKNDPPRVIMMVLNEEAMGVEEWFTNAWGALGKVRASKAGDARDYRPIRMASSVGTAVRLYEAMRKIAEDTLKADPSSKNGKFLVHLLNQIHHIYTSDPSANPIQEFSSKDPNNTIEAIDDIEERNKALRIFKWREAGEKLNGEPHAIDFEDSHTYKLLFAMYIAMKGSAKNRAITDYSQVMNSSDLEPFLKNFLYPALEKRPEFKEGIFTHAIYFRSAEEKGADKDDFIQLAADSNPRSGVMPTLFNTVLDLKLFNFTGKAKVSPSTTGGSTSNSASAGQTESAVMQQTKNLIKEATAIIEANPQVDFQVLADDFEAIKKALAGTSPNRPLILDSMVTLVQALKEVTSTVKEGAKLKADPALIKINTSLTILDVLMKRNPNVDFSEVIQKIQKVREASYSNTEIGKQLSLAIAHAKKLIKAYKKTVAAEQQAEDMEEMVEQLADLQVLFDMIKAENPEINFADLQENIETTYSTDMAIEDQIKFMQGIVEAAENRIIAGTEIEEEQEQFTDEFTNEIYNKIQEAIKQHPTYANVEIDNNMISFTVKGSYSFDFTAEIGNFVYSGTLENNMINKLNVVQKPLSPDAMQLIAGEIILLVRETPVVEIAPGVPNKTVLTKAAQGQSTLISILTNSSDMTSEVSDFISSDPGRKFLTYLREVDDEKADKLKTLLKQLMEDGCTI